jgi:hypothetical protein
MPVALVVAPRSTALRCAACHGELAAERFICALCRTALHVECRLELARCPSLGCPSRLEPRVRLVRPGRRVSHDCKRPSNAAAIVATFVGLATAGSLVATPTAYLLALHALALPLFTAFVGRRRSNARESLWAPIAPVVAFQVIAVPLMLLALALFRWGITVGRMEQAVAFLFIALEPAFAGWLAARITSGPSDDRNPARGVL